MARRDVTSFESSVFNCRSSLVERWNTSSSHSMRDERRRMIEGNVNVKVFENFQLIFETN